MSDVSKTSELIAELRKMSDRIFMGDGSTKDFRIVDQAADALEQADAYIQSMAIKESAFFDMEDRALKAEYALEAATERYEKAEHDRLYWRRRYQTMHKRAKTAEAERDAATEFLEAVNKIEAQKFDLRVERDAALAVIERVRDFARGLAKGGDEAGAELLLAALDRASDNESLPNHCQSCGAWGTTEVHLRGCSLDGAPELTLDPDVIEFRDWTSISYEVNEARTMQRTVVKGDWERLPVEGESNNA